MKPVLLVSLLLSSAVALAQSSQAQSAAPLKLLLSQDLVSTVTENGKTSEKITPMPASVRPGDLLSEQVNASNVGNSTLKGAVIRLSVPKGTHYSGQNLAASERWSTEYSIDGGKTYAPAPLMKTVTVTENGRSVQKKVAVSPSEYTSVRWTVAALKPNETLKLAFRVSVN